MRRIDTNCRVLHVRGNCPFILESCARRKFTNHPGFAVKVADTVGAGDAFTAALLYHALRGASLRAMNDAANRLGAWVASQDGAMPEADEEVLGKVRAG